MKKSLDGNRELLAGSRQDFMFYDVIPLPPRSAIEQLVQQPFGFGFVDLGWDSSTLNEFSQIQVEKNKDLNEFGDFSDLREKIALFLNDLGSNESTLIARAAQKIDETAKEILAVSGRETGWVCLRAAKPNHRYDLSRWHIDGHYFASDGGLQYKFIVNLVGASTLFYPISTQLSHLRRIIWIHMTDRQFTNELFRPEEIVTAPLGTGVVFIAGDIKKGGFHSEPPITQPRLVFSIVPCNWDQLETLKGKVALFYRDRSSVND